MKAVALEEGLVEQRQQKEALGHAVRLLERLRTHAVWAEISASDERHHEVPYVMPMSAGGVDVGVIDPLYRKGSEWL